MSELDDISKRLEEINNNNLILIQLIWKRLSDKRAIPTYENLNWALYANDELRRLSFELAVENV